jgi:PAS domain S-box-containing protein
MSDKSLDDREQVLQVVEVAGDAVMVAGADGVIHYWNAGAEAIFGFTKAEAVGKPMDFIVPERLRGRHWSGWNQVMEKGTTRYGKELLAVPALRKDGTPLSVEFTIQLVRDPQGAIVAVGAILRDVTARWQREREQRKRLAELEAKLAPPK